MLSYCFQADFYGNENADPPKIAGANGPTILDDISEAGREKWIDSILTQGRVVSKMVAFKREQCGYPHEERYGKLQEVVNSVVRSWLRRLSCFFSTSFSRSNE